MDRVVLDGLLVRGGLLLVGAVARQVVLLLLFCRIGLLHLVILARLLRLVTWGGVRLLRGLVALGGVRFLPMFVLCDLLLRWILRRNLVVMFLLDDAGRRSGWASVLASSPRPFLDLQFSIEVVLSVLFHAPRSSHAGSATVEGEQVRLILTASYCSPARPSHGERRLSLLRHAAYPLQRRFLVPLASSGHHRLSLCLLHQEGRWYGLALEAGHQILLYSVAEMQHKNLSGGLMVAVGPRPALRSFSLFFPPRWNCAPFATSPSMHRHGRILAACGLPWRQVSRSMALVEETIDTAGSYNTKSCMLRAWP
ncbi:hypothetical protein CFC21_092388 [Triticum aestivum]|uniref:Uncharacterized protein n=2 Tax=Triticum aestivum TaxID=4565 RepID=A0A3B6QDP0_WHEAT|nr:hypothetical protein CFC21_092388 [Triticum aestivum]